jgi:hypothetical protein
MNFRTIFSMTVFFSLLVSLVPMKSHAEPDLKKILLYGGAAFAALGILKAAKDDKPGHGVTLVIIGAGMAAVAKPEQIQRIVNDLMGKSKAERTLDKATSNIGGIKNWGERTFKDIYDWFPKV